MKLVSLNIEKNKHYDRIFSFLEQEKADVICLQEVLEKDVSFIIDSLGMRGEYVVSDIYIGSHEAYQDVYAERQGLLILSRFVILEVEKYFYWGNENFLKASVDVFRQEFDTYCSHPILIVKVQDTLGGLYTIATTHFPVTKEGTVSETQRRILPSLFSKLNLLEEFVLCGDFNAPRGGEIFSEIASRYKDNVPTSYATSLDQLLHRKRGLQFMVDGLFTTKKYTATGTELKDGVSDHMAIISTITHIV